MSKATKGAAKNTEMLTWPSGDHVAGMLNTATLLRVSLRGVASRVMLFIEKRYTLAQSDTPLQQHQVRIKGTYLQKHSVRGRLMAHVINHLQGERWLHAWVISDTLGSLRHGH